MIKNICSDDNDAKPIICRESVHFKIENLCKIVILKEQSNSIAFKETILQEAQIGLSTINSHSQLNGRQPRSITNYTINPLISF